MPTTATKMGTAKAPTRGEGGFRTRSVNVFLAREFKRGVCALEILAKQFAVTQAHHLVCDTLDESPVWILTAADQALKV